MPYEEAFSAAIAFVLLFILALKFLKDFTWKPKNWPVFGMMPALIRNVHRIHDFATELMVDSGGTLFFKGPWFANMDMMVTADPANVHYILTKNFKNFGRSPEFKKMFSILGNGIFLAEGVSWENQRKAAKMFIGDTSFQKFAAETTWNKVQTGVLPLLETAVRTGNEKKLDLQDIFKRLGFDCIFLLVLGHDPGTLCQDLRDFPEVRAFNDSEEGSFVRHILPETVSKIQKFLQIGTEKKMTEAAEIINKFLEKCIATKQEKLRLQKGNETDHDMFASYMRANHEALNVSQHVWRDATLNFVFAGKDSISTSLSWFFWLLSKNPETEEKIRREIAGNSPTGKWRFSGIEQLKNLVYLHAALCETLRLYPPVALNNKSPLEPDTLPTGHRVDTNSRIVISYFSMARMESVWGEDCLEFKPERWVSDRGTIITVPSFKFTAFNAGPRSCIGKEIAFIQLKITAAAIISRFKFQIAQGHVVSPKASVLILMKNGLKVDVHHAY